MTPYLADPDFTLYQGDVRDVLPELEPGSVDCVITSPPYWGLRDYGTGAWDGGDADCDHLDPSKVLGNTRRNLAQAANRADSGNRVAENRADHDGIQFGQFRDTCARCGATRTDNQLGLERTPDEYVQAMVAVFRQVRRVLADHGTCWINLGDSYTSGLFTRQGKPRNVPQAPTDWAGTDLGERGRAGNFSLVERTDLPGLKPKDLVGVPWRVALALQADGWWLRADVIWSKPNPMPESTTDRPTKSHEYVFLLAKQPRYWFDQEAVREPHTTADRNGDRRSYPPGSASSMKDGEHQEMRGSFAGLPLNPAGRNMRSVWTIATQPYPEAHFATYPEELVRRCLLAGCAAEVCRVCGKPRERIVEMNRVPRTSGGPSPSKASLQNGGPGGAFAENLQAIPTTVGWSDCGHGDYRRGVVLDPFLGSGTTALVARRHRRHSVGIELSAAYADLACERVKWWHRRPETAPAPIDGQLVMD